MRGHRHRPVGKVGVAPRAAVPGAQARVQPGRLLPVGGVGDRDVVLQGAVLHGRAHERVRDEQRGEHLEPGGLEDPLRDVRRPAGALGHHEVAGGVAQRVASLDVDADQVAPARSHERREVERRRRPRRGVGADGLHRPAVDGLDRQRRAMVDRAEHQLRRLRRVDVGNVDRTAVDRLRHVGEALLDPAATRHLDRRPIRRGSAHARLRADRQGGRGAGRGLHRLEPPGAREIDRASGPRPRDPAQIGRVERRAGILRPRAKAHRGHPSHDRARQPAPTHPALHHRPSPRHAGESRHVAMTASPSRPGRAASRCYRQPIR